MNHTEAVSAGAVERYLLGQLSASESDEFEQHFFDCSECTSELRAGAVFEDNARAVFLEERLSAARVPEKASRSREPSRRAQFWQRPWSAVPALAALLLAAVSVYQASIVIPGLRGQLRDALAPQPVESYVLPPVSRGDARVVEVPDVGHFYAIYMDPTWVGSYAAYVCSLQDESGTAKFSVHLTAPPPGRPIEILMARSMLPPGRYTVLVRNAAETGKPERELARYSLILRLD
jgi:hypothetical protein